jgi:bisphosphoglycerate-independent phosphoglycerate mutase (AlkP superfamily)
MSYKNSDLNVGDIVTIKGYEKDRKGRICFDKMCLETKRKVKNTHGLYQFKISEIDSRGDILLGSITPKAYKTKVFGV